MSPSLTDRQKPDLWTYACQQYPGFKSELLAFQDRGLAVNDLLALSYARRYSLYLDKELWEALAVGRTRRLLERVRSVRRELSKVSPLRQAALGWELELERWDLHLLEQCLCATEQWRKQLPPKVDQLDSEERDRLDKLIGAISDD